jgi:toxin ParE1/3/4
MKPVFSTLSRSDIRLIALHIADDNPSAAARWVDQIEEKCAKLARFPRMGRVRDELAPGLLSFPVGAYLIFYRIAENHIEIIRVLHAARDIPAAFTASLHG